MLDSYKNKCIVIIPIYKEPSKIEFSSFIRCINILGKYDIAIVTNEQVNLSKYLEYAKQKEKEITIEFFDTNYFQSIEGYNMLCMSKQFYFRFLPNYKYMLIYQLDAWVFTDNLQEWCDKGYDYIGAPFLSIVKKNSPRVIFKGVGNGGLSLRRIQYCIDVLSLPRYLPFITPIKLMKQFKYKITVNDYSFLKVILLFFLYVLKVIGLRNTLHFYIKNINEDIVFSDYANDSWYISTNIPSTIIAAEFSFDKNPSLLFQLIGNKLPFGCHAFEKYEYDSFWSQYILLDNS